VYVVGGHQIFTIEVQQAGDHKGTPLLYAYARIVGRTLVVARSYGVVPGRWNAYRL